jgi:hypothetical protein
VEFYSIFRFNEDGTIEYNHRRMAASLIVSNEKAEDAFKKVYQKDTVAQQLLRIPPSDTKVTIKQRIILMNGLVYVPQLLQQEIFSQHHETKTAGH